MNSFDPTTAVLGGLSRFVEGAAAATPTLLIGLLIAAILRYYVGPSGTRRLFGGDTLRALPQSWAIGMLLPVCSIGVLPIVIEMYRARVKRGAISAFALSAPLFNPLSLLYGLTLSRPLVILFFAGGSLAVVTIVGWLWDARRTADQGDDPSDQPAAEEAEHEPLIGLRRLSASLAYTTRSLAGPVGGWAALALFGLLLLGIVLPFGAMQSRVERDDWKAPATMTAVSIPAYATPMLAMSQLGMMFQHANSPGAAFVLLALGTGLNLATVGWMGRTFGARPVALWFGSLIAIVVAIAYAINRPLMVPGVEPAGHTHAFDIYTNPFPPGQTLSLAGWINELQSSLTVIDRAALGLLAAVVLIGLLARATGWHPEQAVPVAAGKPEKGLDGHVPPRVVGATALGGLVALSVVMCYSYYPSQDESLEEIRIIRAECLSAANLGNIEHASHYLQLWDDWSRRLEVGTFLREGEVRPYQRMQGYLLRKKLEELEHELEHDPFELDHTKRVVNELVDTSRRWSRAFRQTPAETSLGS